MKDKDVIVLAGVATLVWLAVRISKNQMLPSLVVTSGVALTT